MGHIEVRVVTSQAEMEQALNIRRAVFIQEQAVPEDLEIDEHDVAPAVNQTAIHVIALNNNLVVATARLLLEEHDGYVHIGRVAVLKQHRGRGYGAAVMVALHDIARSRGYEGITLGAQLHAIGFYEKLGYAARGDIFLDAGIEHRWMDRPLRPGAGD